MTLPLRSLLLSPTRLYDARTGATTEFPDPLEATRRYMEAVNKGRKAGIDIQIAGPGQLFRHEQPGFLADKLVASGCLKR